MIDSSLFFNKLKLPYLQISTQEQSHVSLMPRITTSFLSYPEIASSISTCPANKSKLYLT